MRRSVGAALAAALVLACALPAWGQDPAPTPDCCGGKVNTAGADSASGAPVKRVRLSLAHGADVARTREALAGLPGATAVEIATDGASAAVSMPVAYAAWAELEKTLTDKGVAATLLDPVRLTVKLARGDGKVDFKALNGSVAMVAGVLASAPAPAGDALLVWADPSCVDAHELIGIATGRGYQASLTSHELVEAAVPDGFCPSCENVVRTAAAKAEGALGALVDYGTGRVRVLAARGRTSAEQVTKALAAAGFDGKRAERPEACSACRSRR